MIEFIQAVLAGVIVVSIIGSGLYLIHKIIDLVYVFMILIVVSIAVIIAWVTGEYTLILLGIHPYPEHWHGCFMSIC